MRTLSCRFAAMAYLIFAGQSFCSVAFAQQATASKPLMLVTWFGTAIALPAGQDWKLELLTVYDKDPRPVARCSKSDAGLTASFILFENLSGKPTAQGCREE